MLGIQTIAGNQMFMFMLQISNKKILRATINCLYFVKFNSIWPNKNPNETMHRGTPYREYYIQNL